jgi:glyoxylase-like metal-dependent hydrolase (beta-lactamase superfamily II)
VFVHEAELKHAYYSAATEGASGGYLRADFDHDLNWRVVHRDRAQFFDGVEFVRLPGHAPGLMGLLIHLDDESLLFASDVAEMAVHYEDEQPMGGSLMWSKRDWFDSLRFLKDLQRRTDAAVFCGHDADDVAQLREGLP